jgi:hypothetical protein
MENQNENQPNIQDVDQNRRRLTKAGLAAPAVLGVLASRPVLGDVLHHCTPSGHISGFASPPAEGATSCRQGLSPTAYQAGPSTWPALVKAAFTTTQGSNILPLDFKVAPNGYSHFVNAYEVKNSANSNFVRDATVWDVLMGFPVNSNTGARQNNYYLTTKSGFFDDSLFTLGKEAIAASMNAISKYPTNFPIDPNQVVNMFNNVIDGGTDQVTSTADWNAAEVIEYFQSLHT